MNKSDYLEFTKRIAQNAGKILLEHFQTNLTIQTKSNHFDLVTIADQKSEAYLISEIKKNYPDHQILAEETATNTKLKSDTYTWIIDPLDGTVNFNHDLPHWCISIALYYGEKAIVGVVYCPCKNELFYCTNESPSMLNDQQIQVSTRTTNEAMIATGFPYNRDAKEHEQTFQNLRLYHQHFRAVRRLGAAALDLSYVAAGRLDGFFEYLLSPWDTAAGTLLIQQAGGQITHHEFNKFIQVDNGQIEWPA